MGLSNVDMKDQLGNWLASNAALEGTEEYNEKAQMFLKVRQNVIDSQRKDELGYWLASNSDLEDTQEYNLKAREFLKLRERLGVSSQNNLQTTAGQAYTRGLVQGATFEFYDEIKSGVRAATNFLIDNPSDMTFGELYDKFKQEETELMNAYMSEHGGAYLGGQISGGVATLPLGGVMGRAGQLLFGTGGRGATMGETVRKAATASAVQSSLAGAGTGDDLDSRLTNAAIGFGLGFTTGAGISAGGYKLAEKVANSSNGLIYRITQLGASPKSTVQLTEELTPQLVKLSETAGRARDTAYSNWRNTLEGAILDSGKKIFREKMEDNAPKVINTGKLKKLVSGLEDLVDNKSNLKAILNESDIVTFDTYRNLYRTAWDLQKQLPKNKAVPFAKRLDILKGDEYLQLDKMFPKLKLGSRREGIDNAVKVFETGQLLNKEIVEKIAKGEALDPTFAKQFLPNNSASLNSFDALVNRINAWAKEAKLPPSAVDEILDPLRATALTDAINNPRLLKAISEKNKTSEDLTIFNHFKRLLTKDQMDFISRISRQESGSLRRRIKSLMDYYSGAALLGSAGIGGVSTYAAMTGNPMGIAGLAILGTYMASPVLFNTLAKNKQMLALTNKILSAPSDTPTKELTNLTNNLGKAALKSGMMTPTLAFRTFSELEEMYRQSKEEGRD